MQKSSHKAKTSAYEACGVTGPAAWNLQEASMYHAANGTSGLKLKRAC